MNIFNFKRGSASAQTDSLQARITRLLQEAQKDTVVVGVRSRNLRDGTRRSIFKGNAGDFLHPTEYDPQEHDARQIMPMATARTGGQPIYVRINRPETQLPVVLLIDLGRTQIFGSGDESKMWLLAKAAVSLCFSLRDSQDRVLPIIFGGSEKVWTTGVPSSPHQVMYQLAEQLLQPTFAPTACTLEQALNMVPDRPSEVVIISDFLSLTPELAAKLGHCGRRNSTRAVVIQDSRERELPPPRRWCPIPSLLPVFDLGTGEEASWWNTAANRDRYRREFREREQWLQAIFEKNGIRFATLETNQGKDAICKFLRLMSMPPLT